MPQLAPFVNEPYADFKDPAIAAKMREALGAVRAEFGREYELLVGGRARASGDRFESLNPSRPSEVVGIHQECDEHARSSGGGWRGEILPALGGAGRSKNAIELVLRLAEIIRPAEI